MSEQMADDTRNLVRDHYAKVSTGNAGCAPGCCAVMPSDQSTKLGYSAEDLAAVGDGADLGLGCGNPTAIASLRPGETVLDLGSGGGFDSFLAARAVGPTGQVIGVDMTPEMITRARANARKLEATNVEFRLGEIEHLPVADGTADVVISNCVINLSPDKAQVFHDAFRVLKPGGRLAISDVVATAELPEAMRQDAALIAGCMGNASLIGDLEAMMRAAGFAQIRIEPKDESKAFIADWAPGRNVTDYVVAATIEAVKPGACCGGSRC